MAILLAELQHATSTTDERRRGFWIDFHSRQWRRILGRGYADVIRTAESAGFVQVNHRYSQSRFCKSYRLATPYRRPDVAQVRISQRIGKANGNRIRLERSDVTGLNLAAWFPSVAIPDSVVSTGWDLFCVRSVQRRTFYAVRCPYRRFHSTFTGLPKRIRAALRIHGRPVVETDVANCQPLFLGLLAAGQHQGQDRGQGQNQEKRQEKRQEKNQPPTRTTPERHPTPPYTICGAPSDLRRYLDLCQEGRLYDYLLACCGGLTLWSFLPVGRRHRYGVDRALNRADVKRQFIVAIFSPVATMRRMRLWDVVSREFPTVAAFIEDAKRIEYQALARDCQRFESSVMIDSVAAELAERWPIITIHDSIIAAEENADIVAETIRRRFRALGCDVAIREGQGAALRAIKQRNATRRILQGNYS